jgi:hypothetical protein
MLRGTVLLDRHEYYVKQTYRNRCEILSANGVMTLTVPVVHGGTKISVRDVRIDYSRNWQTVHRRAIAAAYGSSPFYEYYADDLVPFFERRETFLFDLNLRLTELFLELVGLKADIRLSDEYVSDCGGEDFRSCIRPKSPPPDPAFACAPYRQVFDARFGFRPDLSILDLLCNEGNNSFSIIEQCILDT